MYRTPTKQAREQLLGLPCEPEELRINGREVYIYYPDGMGRSKLKLKPLEPATVRNINTVTKLVVMMTPEKR